GFWPHRRYRRRASSSSSWAGCFYLGFFAGEGNTAERPVWQPNRAILPTADCAPAAKCWTLRADGPLTVVKPGACNPYRIRAGATERLGRERATVQGHEGGHA